MRAGLVFLSCVAAFGCGRVPRSEPVDAARPMETMLDPARLESLRPAAVVAHLALLPDAVVADIGAGPGAFTHLLARAVPRGRVIATEIQARHLQHIADDARQAGEANIETRLVTPEDPGLIADEVDLAFLCQVDHYLRDRRAYFTKLATAIRPGGRVVIMNYLRERVAIENLAAELGWRELGRWEPAPGLFARAYSPAPRR